MIRARRRPRRARRREPDPDRYTRSATPIATCWSSAPARPASRRRWPRPRPARASSSATSRPSSAARCSPRPSADDRRQARRRLARATRVADACAQRRTCGCCRARTAFGYYRAELRRARRARRPTISPIADPEPAARAAVAGARQRGGAGDRRDRAAAGLPGQRPARRHAGRRGAALSQPLRRQGRRRASSSSTAHDSAYRAALDLETAGVDDRGDRRSARRGRRGRWRRAARARGHRVVAAAHDRAATSGRLRVIGRIAPSARRHGRRARRVACDLAADVGRLDALGASLLAIARQAALRRGAAASSCRAWRRRRERSAGACQRHLRSRRGARRRRRGRARPRRGDAAARRIERAHSPVPAIAPDSAAARVEPLPHHARPRRVKAFVDFQNDVTAKDIELAVREGFRSIEHVKRYTTTGMATDQGKTSNMNALGIAAAALGKPIPRGRPHHLPPALYAGDLRRLRRPCARRPVRSRAPHADPRLGGGKRRGVRGCRASGSAPGISRSAGEDMHEAVARECRAVRASVGLFDASTLGKIEVVGPDAAEFLEPHLRQRLGRSSRPGAAATASC